MFGFGPHRAAVRNRPVALRDPEPSLSDLLVPSAAVRAVYDSSNAGSVTRPDGGAPTLWSDKVGVLANLKGGGFDLAAPSSSQAPQWRSGAFLFDGVDDLLSTELPSGTNVANLALLAIYKGTDEKTGEKITNGGVGAITMAMSNNVLMHLKLDALHKGSARFCISADRTSSGSRGGKETLRN